MELFWADQRVGWVGHERVDDGCYAHVNMTLTCCNKEIAQQKQEAYILRGLRYDMCGQQTNCVPKGVTSTNGGWEMNRKHVYQVRRT